MPARDADDESDHEADDRRALRGIGRVMTEPSRAVSLS
jgi:hypothetical protein